MSRKARAVESPASDVGAFWALEEAALMAALGSRPGGLTQAEAAARLEQYGPNTVRDRRELSALRLLVRQFASPLVLILVFGAAIALLLHELLDASIVLLIVLGSCALGFLQEFNASRAVQALRERLALSVKVLRDGALTSRPVVELVPGDVVELSAGNLVPADGRVLSERDFLVSEAALTGESFPVEKEAGTVAGEAPITGRSNAVFLGTSVRSGTARVLIAVTGRGTALGAIAARLEAPLHETDFARGVRQFGYLLLKVMMVMVVFVLTINLAHHRPLADSLLFAVALAVGLSPELLPAIVSVTLSAGARAMAARGVIVRRLELIENLGSMDVLCTDKTGTLTEGKIVLHAALGPDGAPSTVVAELAAVNATLQTGIDNPLDAAIVAAAPDIAPSIGRYRKVDEIPYDFQRRRLTIVVAEADAAPEHRIVTKGAYTHVRDCCALLLQGEEAVPLDAAARDRLDRFYEEKGRQGFRVLGLAVKTSAPRERYGRADEQGMTFAGFLLFLDPIKPEITATLADLARLGIGIKIVTGDNRFVASHVAEAIGLDGHALLTGEDMQSLSRSGAMASRRSHRRVRRGRSAAEGAYRPRAATRGPRGGLSGRWDQRRPGAVRGRCRHLRRSGGGRGARKRRYHLAQARPRCLAPGRRGWTAHLRQHAEIYLDHHQRQFRQHAEHGARHAVPSLPAAAAEADPAQQLPVGFPLRGDLHRQCRCAADREVAALEPRRAALLHARCSALPARSSTC